LRNRLTLPLFGTQDKPIEEAPQAKAPTQASSSASSVKQEMCQPEPAGMGKTIATDWCRDTSTFSDVSIAPKAMWSVDEPDIMDPQAAVEYIEDMYEHARTVEVKRMVSPNYMNHQADINERMRAILIDWLVDVHLKFKLVPETLYLTIQLIDRYLEKRTVKRQKLQLVGVTAMLIASKYEEIYAPEVHDFVYISDRAYTHEEILEMETCMLRSLEFRITSPSILKFMNRYAKIAQGDSTVSWLASYYAERMLPEYHVLQWAPSQLGATALALARRTVGKTLWKPDLEQYSGYSEAVLTQSYNTMLDMMQPNAGSGRKSNLQAVFKKYSGPKFGEVAKMYSLPSKA
jgi:hypothetical protein